MNQVRQNQGHPFNDKLPKVIYQKKIKQSKQKKIVVI